MRTLKSLTIALLTLLIASTAFAETINVSAAISLKEALTEISKAYEQKTGDKVELAFGSSGQIAGQIKAGINADIFISAAQKQVDDLAKDGLTLENSTRVIARNTLVLIAPVKPNHPITDFKDLADPGVKRIAIGEPKTVPAGQYATQALTSLKLTDAVKDKLIYGANVRQVLTYVEMGEVDAGFVYLTDAKESGDKVKIIKTVPETAHQPIIYPAVILKSSSKTNSANQFLDFFNSDKAKAILQDKGFTLATEKATS